MDTKVFHILQVRASHPGVRRPPWPGLQDFSEHPDIINKIGLCIGTRAFFWGEGP